MKKRIISFLVMVSVFFIAGNVKALDMLKNDVPNGSYVIGTHMFTREVTEDYDGTLTVQRIMLAAKTINSNNIADMKIYYKNSRGNWVDALTSQSISMNDTIDIKYKNTKVSATLETPNYGYETDFFSINEGKFVVPVRPQTKYSAEEYMGTGYSYERCEINNNGKSNCEELSLWQGGPESLSIGEIKNYVIRIVKNTDGSKEYSEWSDILTVDTNKFRLDKPILIYNKWTATTDDENYIPNLFSTSVYSNEEYMSENYGYEIYEIKENGDYSVTESQSLWQGESGLTKVPFGETRSYISRVYYEYEGTKIYSDYSNIVEVVAPNNNLSTPVLSNYGIGGDGQQMNVVFNLGNVDITTIDGIEVYRAAETDTTGVFEMIPNIEITEDQGLKIIEVPYTQSSKYKVRTYKNIDGVKIYSAYSNLALSALLSTPQISKYGIGGDGQQSNIAFKFEALDTEITGIEVYRATYGTEEYELVPNIEITENQGSKIIEVPYNALYIYKVRAYKEVDGIKFYSEYSNSVQCYSLNTPILEFYEAGCSIEEECNATYRVVNVNIENIDGIEVYKAPVSTNNYELIPNIMLDGIGTTNYIHIPFMKNDSTVWNYKMRTYKTVDGVKVYSEYSNIV